MSKSLPPTRKAGLRAGRQMSNESQIPEFKILDNLNLRFDLNFELWHLNLGLFLQYHIGEDKGDRQGN
jgi:hypothetical protein